MKDEYDNIEYYDVLNSFGITTGRIEKKGYYEDNYYLGVHCYIEDMQGQFLIQNRSSTVDSRRICNGKNLTCRIN